MSQRRLTREECTLLNEVVASRDLVVQSLASDVIGGRILTAIEANALRNAIGNELANTGVDEETGAINDRGLLLDDLIDRIGHLSQLWQ